MHGTPGSRMLLPSVIRSAIERGICVIGYDRPGYGGSTPHPGRTVADAAADVEAIADGLGLERILVDGVSGGGPHALACAAKLGDRVAAVGLYASLAPADAVGLDFLAGHGPGQRRRVDGRGRRARRRSRRSSRPRRRRSSPSPSTTWPPRCARTSARSTPPRSPASWPSTSSSRSAWPSRCGATAGSTTTWPSCARGASTSPTSRCPWASGRASRTRWCHRPTAAGWPPTCPGIEAHITPDDGHLTLAGDELVEISLDWLVSRYKA